MTGPFFDRIDCRELKLSPYEVAARLHTHRGYTDDRIKACLSQLLEAADCKYSFVRTTVEVLPDDRLDLGFTAVKSSDLCRNLKNCSEAFIFTVTAGINVDRLLLRLSLLSEADNFITDGLASALAEAACEEAERRIKGALVCRPRYSPGFGDLGLEIQPEILKITQAKNLLGVTISSSLLMTPVKSITAIMGIINEN